MHTLFQPTDHTRCSQTTTNTITTSPPPPGGFRPQAQVASSALRVLHQAKALQEAGCFSIVLECIPGPIAAAITKALRVPTIGIGAGPATSGQVGGGKAVVVSSSTGKTSRQQAASHDGCRMADNARLPHQQQQQLYDAVTHGRGCCCHKHFQPSQLLLFTWLNTLACGRPLPTCRCWCTTTCWA